MFDSLSDKLQSVLGGLRSRGTLDEETISKAMREIRLALLEADVNLDVVKELHAAVKERALGQEVTKSLTPGQQVVKIVHEELTRIMGGGDSRLAFAGRPPTVILLVGLQGSGKTTAAGKLALMLRKDGRSPLLVAADLQRPAAVTQLEQLGRELQIPVASAERKDPVAAARAGVEQARTQGRTRHRRHRRPAPDRRRAHGRARADPRRDEAAQRPARPRRDDGTGGGAVATRVPGAGRVRRRRPDEARR